MMPSLLEIWKGCLQGKTVVRILGHAQMRAAATHLRGRVIDLASGPPTPFARSIPQEMTRDIQLVRVDAEPRYQPDVLADLTQPLPFESNSADSVLMLSFLYIASDPRSILKEAFRVLKPGGSLYLNTPLVFPFTPEPTDHWRFTEQGIAHLAHETGFKIREIRGLGDRWSASLYLLSPFVKPRNLLLPPLIWLSLLLDRMTARFTRFAPCPIGYFTILDKR